MRRVVRDLMTKDVIVVREATPYKEIVEDLTTAGVNAVPVVDADGRLVGIVSEGDLLLKEGHAGRGVEHHRREHGLRRVEHGKARGVVARDLMTTPVTSVSPDASAAEAARLMHERRVKQLPVVETGSVIGIVSRRDILGIFLRSDEEIRNELVHDVIEGTLWLTPEEASIRVTVDAGVVTLQGTIDRKSMLDIVIRLAYGVEGVVGVVNRMRFVTDDTRIRPEPMLPWGVLPPSLRRP